MFILVKGEVLSLSSPNSKPTEKESLTLICVSSPSLPQPEFRWIRDDIDLRSSTFISIATSHVPVNSGAYISTSNLTISPVELLDSGVYRCIISQSIPSSGAQLTSAANLPVSVNCKFFRALFFGLITGKIHLIGLLQNTLMQAVIFFY